MKRGSEYELLTQQVYQILLDSGWSGKNICVQHDIKLVGSSGQEHQIDVYWEYELAGIKNKVVIECKEYGKPLPIGKVRDFYGVLVDLKDVKGIIVASKGFQKGAKEYAQSYGINLKELVVSSEAPVIAEFELNFQVAIRRHLFKIDEDWAKENGWNIDLMRKRQSFLSMNSQEWLQANHFPLNIQNHDILDTDGKKISSLDDLDSSIDTDIVGGREYIFPFEEAYVTTLSGPVKITEIKILDIEKTHTHVDRLVAEGCVKAILKDAIDGKIQNILCPLEND